MTPSPTPPVILVDGIAGASISPLDRGLAFADGIFRTLRVRAGRPLNWQWHVTRLRADCAMLALPQPDMDLLAAEIARAAPGDATVKIIYTRGAATRGYAIAPGAKPTRVVMAFAPAAYPASHAADGITVRRCTLALSEQPRLAGAKTLSRLENVMARAEWEDAAIAEGLLADAAGRVVEATMSNVFVVQGGRAATPRLTRCGVVGAQRERVRALLAREGIACEERDLTWQDVESADEVFLTNSLIGAWPVAQFGERHWKPGTLTKKVQALIERDDAHA